MDNTSAGPTRERLVAQGAQLIAQELDNQAQYVIDIQRDQSLRNVDILSPGLIANRSVHKRIRNQVKEYQGNVHKILLATAHFIEEERFDEIDQAVAALDLSKFDKDRLTSLIESQKSLRFSFQTLAVVIEIFQRVNEQLLTDIKEAAQSATPGSSPDQRLDRTRLHLKNAILVYELYAFVVAYLERFQLAGLDDLLAIRDQVLADCEANRKADLRLKKQLKNTSEAVAQAAQTDMANREGVRNLIKAKWDSMLSDLKQLSQGIETTRRYIGDLSILRDNARNQIEVLNLMATTQLVERTLDVITGLTQIDRLPLAPLDEKLACELLGIGLNGM